MAHPGQPDQAAHRSPLREEFPLGRQQAEELPDSVRRGQRLTGMSANQATLPLAGTAFKFKQHGQSGAWISDLLPHTAEIADELCFIKSMHTEAINHDPAITFFKLVLRFPVGLQWGHGSAMVWEA